MNHNDSTSAQALCSLSELAALQYMFSKSKHLKARLAKSLLAGGNFSKLKGRGMEFDQVRPYQAGDDIRTIDWKITARYQQPYTKLFSEEKEIPTYLVTNLSNSMFFGSQNSFKSVKAMQLSSLICWRTLAKGDRVGGLLFEHDNHCIDLKAQKNKKHILFLIKKMIEAQNNYMDSQSTCHANFCDTVLPQLLNIKHPGAEIYIISDFYDLSDKHIEYLLQLRRKHTLKIIRITDPLELNIPGKAVLNFQVSDKTQTIDLREAKSRKLVSKQIELTHNTINSALTKCATSFIPISTEQNLSAVVDAL